MSEQASRDSFRVRGEDVPVWLPWGMALLGLIGGTIAAQLLLPARSDGSATLSRRVEITASTTQPAPPMAEVDSDKIPHAPVLADEPSATRAREASPPSAAADSGLVSEQLSATPAAGGLEPDDGSTLGGPAPRAVSMKQGEGEQTPPPQVVSPPTPPVDEGETDATATDETSAGTRSEPSTEVLADTAGPVSRSIRADAGRDEGQTIRTASEAASDASPISSATVGAEEPEIALPQTESADSIAAQDSRHASDSDTGGQTSAVQAQPQHRGDKVSKQAIDEAVIDCAPLFSVRFNHGSVVPRDRNIGGRIARLARWLDAHPAVIVYVDGHADSSGPEELNLVISFRRAASVAALLTEAGASEAQVVRRAYGESPSLSPSIQTDPERRVILRTDAGGSCNQQESDHGDSE